MKEKKSTVFSLSSVPQSRRVILYTLLLFLLLVWVPAANAQDCECIICHGPYGPHSGGFPGCTACHGNPPISDQPGEDGLVRYPALTGAVSAGAHQKHATSSGYNYDCQTCHFEGMPVTLIADNGEFQMGFNYKEQGGGVYDGRVLPDDYVYVATSGTTLTTNGSMTCANIYCHSNGTSVTTEEMPTGASPSWDTEGPLACDACHGYPPQYAQDDPKSNSHVIHFEQLQQFPWFSCATCHYSTTNDGVTIADYTTHVNMQYDVNPDPSPEVDFDYVYDKGGGKCLNISCHGGGHPGWTNVWGAVSLNVGITKFYGPSCYQVGLSASVTGGTGPYTFFWEFGDDTTGTGDIVSHTYPGNGPYYPKLTVTDANNHVGTRTTEVTPRSSNAAPVAAKSISVANKTVTLTDLSYDSDYNSCGHTGGPGTIRIYWGDGTAILIQSINLTDQPSNMVFTHTYTCSVSCTYTIQHSVVDNSGAISASANTTIAVPTRINISGAVTHPNGTPFPFVRMTLYLSGTTQTYGSPVYASYPAGTYSFSNVPEQCYDVKPSANTFSFTPAFRTICTTTSGVDFTADH
jgi:predicted CxxxxCH...CXXCH cytochrome family protein